MKYIVLSAAILLMVSCGNNDNRVLNGTSNRITIDQIDELANIIQNDCSKYTSVIGKNVLLGKFVVRFDGEIFSSAKLMYPAAFGLKTAGAIILDSEQNENRQKPDLILCGEGYVNTEEIGDQKKSRKKYSFIIKLVDLNGVVTTMEKYEIDNISEYTRYR